MMGDSHLQERPIRILHVIGQMGRGGAETWLLHVLRNIDRNRFQMDFLVHKEEEGAYDAEVKALGGKIIPCTGHNRPLSYARNLRKILQDQGPYDIVHSHIHFYSGVVLRAARHAGVPVRIAHSHNDTSSAEAGTTLTRRIYLNVMRRWLDSNATAGLAVSRCAANDLFGPSWESDARWNTIWHGIDLTPFRDSVDRAAVRAELQLPQNAFVIGHVGRFSEQKNHAFILEIMKEVAERDSDTHLLLVGDGELRQAMEIKQSQMGLAGRITFAGLRPDTARLMLGAMDALLFPSHHEGMPLVLIEAQAAGLPCFISDVIGEEADVVKPLMKRLSLTQSASEWADAVLALKASKPLISQSEALSIIEQKPVNIAISAKYLEAVYAGA
jgi:glycosyltransferase involved in cell wall biosynthesis